MTGTGYAIAEIVWWLLVAALIGFVIGWLLRRWFLDRQESERLTDLEAEEEKKRDALRSEIEGWKGKVAAGTADLDKHNADLERMRTQIEEREGKIAELEAKMSGHRTTVSKLESKVEDREATIAALRASIGKEDTQVTVLRKDLDAAIGAVGVLRKDADGYKSTIDALRADLDKERHSHARFEEELAAARSEVASASSSVTGARTAADGLQARIAELEESGAGSADLDGRIASLETELSRVRQDRDATARKLADLESVHAGFAVKPAEAPSAVPAPDPPDKDAAIARVAEIATRTRGSSPTVQDDLKKIHGVGPKLEEVLKSMDITSFRQVAGFTGEDIQYVTAALDAFAGRIERDDWMSSAADEHLKKYGEPV